MEAKGSYMRRRLATCLVFVILILFAVSLKAQPPKPNIIFILADDLGYGDIGYTRDASFAREKPRLHTPNLDRLARNGAILTDHYCAAPVCAPSRASLLLGRVQGRCSLRDNCFDRPFIEEDTLGTVAKAAGYETWAVGKWGIAGGGESGEAVSSHPLDKGFDYFYGFLDHMAGHTYYHYQGHIRGAYMGITENREDATASAIGRYSTDLFAAKTKELICRHQKENPDTPFFLYLAVNTIHGSAKCDDTLIEKSPLHVPGGPYPEDGVKWPLAEEPIEKRNTYIYPAYTNLPPAIARYTTAITRLDEAIGDIVKCLEENKLDHNTLIIFTSDNGPANEYGADPANIGSNGPFDGLKRDVFEGGMRVPAFAYWPSGIAPGTTDREPSQFHDWMATIADIAGVQKPALCDGVSLLPRWEGAKSFEPSLIYSIYEYPWGGTSETFKSFEKRKAPVRGLQRMARIGDFVALETAMRSGTSRIRLYNVREDPFQSTDLSNRAEYADILEKLKYRLDSLWR